MSDFNKTSSENPDGDVGPHASGISQEEGASRGTERRHGDGGLGPHSTVGGKGTVTSDGGLGPHS